LPLFLAWDKARGGRISAVIFDRRATPSQAKSNATLRAQSQGAAGGVVGSLQPIGRDARRRRLAIRPLRPARGTLQFFNRLLGTRLAAAILGASMIVASSLPAAGPKGSPPPPPPSPPSKGSTKGTQPPKGNQPPPPPSSNGGSSNSGNNNNPPPPPPPASGTGTGSGATGTGSTTGS